MTGATGLQRPDWAPEDPTDLLRSIIHLAEAGHDEVTGHLQYTGTTPPQALGRVFGGQVMAQSLTAATRTLQDAAQEHLLHSMHGYFIRPGNAREPITFTVENLRDGRSFSVRRVHASQQGKVILTLSCSFQVPAAGVEHAEPMPRGVPDPESVPTAVDLLGGIEHPVAQEWAWARPFEIRHVQPAVYLTPAEAREATNMVWMRTRGPYQGDENTQRAALAYASDYTLLEPILRRHGLAWIKPGMNVASLDHAMWWHRPARVDEWLLYVQDSPSAQGARGLGHGRIYTGDGELIASVVQEGMLRLPQFDTAD